jgi:hypothetical protein
VREDVVGRNAGHESAWTLDGEALWCALDVHGSSGRKVAMDECVYDNLADSVGRVVGQRELSATRKI